MSDVHLEQCEQCKAPVGFHMSDCPSCASRFPEQVTRWQPCEIDSEDGEAVFQGFLTDPAGEWVKWEDLNRVRVAAYNLELEQKHAALKARLIDEQAWAVREHARLVAAEARIAELEASHVAQVSALRKENAAFVKAGYCTPAERAVLDAAATEGPLKEWGLMVWTAERARREAAE